MRQRSPSATFQQMRQKWTLALTSWMALARRSASAGSTLSRWKAIRWALLGPIPGSRPSSSIRSWTEPSYMSQPQAGWQPHALGDAAEAVGGQVLGLAQALVDGGRYQVAEHLDVVGVQGGRVDRDRLHRRVALDPGGHHAAAGGALDDLLGQLRLGLLHLALHLLQLLEHLVGVEASTARHAHSVRPFLAQDPDRRGRPLAREPASRRPAPWFGRSSMTCPPSARAAQSATARASASASMGRPSSLAGSTSNSATGGGSGGPAAGPAGSSGPSSAAGRSPTTTRISRPPPSTASSTALTWR